MKQTKTKKQNSHDKHSTHFSLLTQYRRAQVAIEFIIIVGALMFFLSLFLLAIQEKFNDQSYKRENILLKDIALTVQNEINLATKSSDGYLREFDIPEKAGNLNYEITIDNEVIHIKTVPLRHALTVSTPKIVGNVNKTHNTIKKISGIVYLN